MAVHTYFLYELDEAGRIFGRRDIEAIDDHDAVNAARRLSFRDAPHHEFEVWIGSRLVFQSIGI